MSIFLLIHRHQPGECCDAQAAWKAVDPRLPDTAPAVCAEGGHTIWWKVRAGSRDHALELVPDILRERTEPVPIH
jgi:hypothetical protein